MSSQVSDAYTSSFVLGCGIEANESSCDYDEAVVQLGIWCSSGLEKMRSMNNRVMPKTSEPSVLYSPPVYYSFDSIS
jgi:hypothetical protein